MTGAVYKQAHLLTLNEYYNTLHRAHPAYLTAVGGVGGGVINVEALEPMVNTCVFMNTYAGGVGGVVLAWLCWRG